MKTSTLFLLLLLMGCQTATQPYDGVIGYEVTSSSADTVNIVYTDSAERSWGDIERRAKQVCASKLQSSNITISVSRQKAFSQFVDVAITVPTGITEIADYGPGNKTVFVPTNTTRLVKREVELKSLLAECTTPGISETGSAT